jgi:hypothetical protein
VDMHGAAALGRMMARAIGLGPSRKLEECNALIQVINTGVQNLERGGKFSGDPSGVGELSAMADAMDQVAAEAGKVKLTVPFLRKAAAEYGAMAQAVGKAARDMARAAAAKDATKINAAQADMEKAVKLEDPLVDRINAFCRTP